MPKHFKSFILRLFCEELPKPEGSESETTDNFHSNLMEVMTFKKISESTLNKYIVEYKFHWIINKHIFVKMELCTDSLDQVIKNKHKIFERNPKQDMSQLEYFFTFQIFKELTESLQFLHTLRPPVVHLDLKPKNVLITDRNNDNHFLKITDFGGAKFLEDNKTKTLTSAQITPRYVAPEIMNGQHFKTQADIYSLGIITSELFCVDIYAYVI